MAHNEEKKILPEIIDVVALQQGLYDVVSQSEAQRMWGKSQKTLDFARWRGMVKARKSGKQWLITVASLVALYGLPTSRMDIHPEDAYFLDEKDFNDG